MTRASLYDHATSKRAVSAQRAALKATRDDAAQRVAEQQRREVYRHPSSIQRRADEEADRRGTAGDRIAQLRQAHRKQVVELGEKHRREALKLNEKHQLARHRDPMMAQGKRPSPDQLNQEKHEVLTLSRRHDTERRKLSERQKRELAVAVAQ